MEPQMDWQQVSLNGGAPCFHVEELSASIRTYCGRAQRWEGHGNPAFHNYVSLTDLLVKQSDEALKGICVYCGAIEQYESLEQKAGDEGNRMRVAHIRQCAMRPELKLIACAEEMIAALKQWVHWCAVDSTEFNRDSAYDTTLALLEKYQRAESRPRNESENEDL